jgi:hypothetical protein
VDTPTLREDVTLWAVPILRQRCSVEQNWVLKRRQRWWFTFKALAVLVLRLDEYGGREVDSDSIEVAHVGFQRTFHPDYGEGGGWDSFVVGMGVRRGWWFGVRSDGWP